MLLLIVSYFQDHQRIPNGTREWYPENMEDKLESDISIVCIKRLDCSVN